MDSGIDQQRQPSGRKMLSGRPLSRRAFVAVAGATAATGVLPATAGAQNGDDVEPVYTDAAISATVPTLDRDDYTGLFVQVVRLEAEEGIDIGVEACPVIDASEEAVAYETRLIDRIEGDRTWTSAILYTDTTNEEIDEGKLFVVNTQEPCSEDFVSLNLEQIGAGRIGETGPERDPNGTTTDDQPGFGVLSAVVGLGAASAAALRRLNGDR